MLLATTVSPANGFSRLRNDLGIATLTERMAILGYIRHHYTEDYKSIQFSQNSGKLHACANSSYQAFLFPLPPNAWVRGYWNIQNNDHSSYTQVNLGDLKCNIGIA